MRIFAGLLVFSVMTAGVASAQVDRGLATARKNAMTDKDKGQKLARYEKVCGTVVARIDAQKITSTQAPWMSGASKVEDKPRSVPGSVEDWTKLFDTWGANRFAVESVEKHLPELFGLEAAKQHRATCLAAMDAALLKGGEQMGYWLHNWLQGQVAFASGRKAGADATVYQQKIDDLVASCATFTKEVRSWPLTDEQKQAVTRGCEHYSKEAVGVNEAAVEEQRARLSAALCPASSGKRDAKLEKTLRGPLTKAVEGDILNFKLDGGTETQTGIGTLTQIQHSVVCYKPKTPTKAMTNLQADCLADLYTFTRHKAGSGPWSAWEAAYSTNLSRANGSYPRPLLCKNAKKNESK